MTEFQQFMNGLRSDARLGRIVAPVADQKPEIVVLTLALALADSREGRNPNPAFELLEAMQR
ncbi:MAG: hypothetical protein NTV52_21580 [Acidobacteria bacterium]|nr:hypothetical protein [Acidobacteriota bacterium]